MECTFPAISGRLDPREGYRVFAALCRLELVSHADDGVQVLPLSDRLVIRAGDCERFGRELTLETSCGVCRLSKPTTLPVLPSQDVHARFVTIKGATSRECFEGMVAWNLSRLGIECPLQVGNRDVIHVAGNRIVGYPLSLYNLEPQESLLLLSNGLGGRRRFGGGVFLPC